MWSKRRFVVVKGFLDEKIVDIVVDVFFIIFFGEISEIFIVL